MLGAIGATCAFPFAGDELYGQHVHTSLAQSPAPGPYAPTFFTPAEYATLSRLTDVIIPATETPGASAAGVPEYVDRVVALNKEHQPLIRAGLEWLERQAKTRFSKEFLALEEAQHIAILQPLSDEIDRQRRDTHVKRFRPFDSRASALAQGKTVYYVAITDRDYPARVAPAKPVALEIDPALPVRFFRLVKNLTADGYYTSRIGLLEELGYVGNTALARFPTCTVKEH
jgi:gluconate 2-dehydrogenase gamma chain